MVFSDNVYYAYIIYYSGRRVLVILYEEKKKIKLDVIGINEDNNLIVSRESLTRFKAEVDREVAILKMQVNRLSEELRENRLLEIEKFRRRYNENNKKTKI